MKKQTIYLALVNLVLGTVCGAQCPEDFDCDGVTDSIESELLVQFAPVWRSNDDGQRPPLPVEWYVSHCQLRWYDQPYNGSSNPGHRLGDTGDTVLSVSYLAGYNYNQGSYRLGFKHGSWRDGDDGDDRITWQRLQQEQRGVYGRVAPLDGRNVPGCNVLPGSEASCVERYLVQYFMFFGYNATDHPDEGLGPCGNFGDHEGDVVGVDFEVLRPSSGGAYIQRAVYHNHGRKIFVDSAAALRFEGGHPIVFLERESQEAVPWPGDCGFWPNTGIPPCVGTEEVFRGYEVAGYRFGAECEDWQVVREHWGRHFGDNQPGFLVTAIVNLGEAGHPGPSPEAQWLDKYPGLFGDEAFDEVCICYLFSHECFKGSNATSPAGPRYQSKMWCREGYNDPRESDWLGCKNIGTAYVSFGFSGPQGGTPSNPFNSLPNALPVMASGGTIIISSGSTSWRPTICQPVTLTSSGGTVTIGQ